MTAVVENCPADAPDRVKHQEVLLNGTATVETSLTESSLKSISTDDLKTKKKVNICTDVSPTGLEHAEEKCSETSESCDRSLGSDRCLTVTGTIKRGKKAGQSLDVKINISREEFDLIEADIVAKETTKKTKCSLQSGPHIVLLTILCAPFVLIIATIYSFYFGTLTWYNIFTYTTEEKNVFIKLCFSPLLVLLYPILICVFALGLGLYAAIVQISWFLIEWQREFWDWEKGFYGWFSSVIHLEECSPYEVVVLQDVKESRKNNSQDSILT